MNLNEPRIPLMDLNEPRYPFFNPDISQYNIVPTDLTRLNYPTWMDVPNYTTWVQDYNVLLRDLFGYVIMNQDKLFKIPSQLPVGGETVFRVSKMEDLRNVRRINESFMPIVRNSYDPVWFGKEDMGDLYARLPGFDYVHMSRRLNDLYRKYNRTGAITEFGVSFLLSIDNEQPKPLQEPNVYNINTEFMNKILTIIKFFLEHPNFRQLYQVNADTSIFITPYIIPGGITPARFTYEDVLRAFGLHETHTGTRYSRYDTDRFFVTQMNMIMTHLFDYIRTASNFVLHPDIAQHTNAKNHAIYIGYYASELQNSRSITGPTANYSKFHPELAIMGGYLSRGVKIFKDDRGPGVLTGARQVGHNPTSTMRYFIAGGVNSFDINKKISFDSNDYNKLFNPNEDVKIHFENTNQEKHYEQLEKQLLKITYNPNMLRKTTSKKSSSKKSKSKKSSSKKSKSKKSTSKKSNSKKSTSKKSKHIKTNIHNLKMNNRQKRLLITQ